MTRISEERLAEFEHSLYSGNGGLVPYQCKELISALREAYAEIDDRQLKLNQATFRKSGQQVITDILLLSRHLSVWVCDIKKYAMLNGFNP